MEDHNHFSQEYVIEHPWHVVTACHWRKYPHPTAPHVRSCHVVDRWITAAGHLFTQRFTSLKAPSIASWIGVTEGHVLEVSTVDPVDKVMTLTTQNLSYSGVVGVTEVCSYRPDPAAPQTRTLFQQDYTVAALVPPKTMIEKGFVSNFAGNSSKGRAVIEALCTQFGEQLKSQWAKQ